MGQNLRDDDEKGRFNLEMAGIARDPDIEHFFLIDRFDDFQRIEQDLVLKTCREAPPGTERSDILPCAQSECT